MKQPNSYLLSIVSGAIFSLSWPTYGFFPLIFFAFIPILFLTENPKLSLGEIYKHGFIAFLIWNIAATWWICKYDFFGGMTVILLNSLSMATVPMIYVLLMRKHVLEKWKLIIFCSLWLTWEWVQQYWGLSWPWLNIGNVFASAPKIVQWYEFTGLFGGTLWVLLVNVLLFEISCRIREKRFNRRLIIWVVSLAFVVFAPIIFSIYRYHSYVESKNPMNVVVVQQNTNPMTEQNERYSDTIINRIYSLAEGALDTNTSLLLCPESAIQGLILEKNVELTPAIIKLRTLFNQFPKLTVIIGATTASNTQEENTFQKKYNSAIILKKSYPTQFYHKSKLVPGVEALPFKIISKPIMQLFKAKNDGERYQRDNHPSVFTIDEKNRKAGVLICYESLYGEWITDFVNRGAEFLAIITNDGWWDKTEGYKQHFVYTQLRAIEMRRSIVRAGNTGISALINQRGDIEVETQWNQRQTLKGVINTNKNETFYVKHGDYIFQIANLITLISFMLLLFNMLTNRSVKL